VVLRRKPQCHILCECEALASLRHTHLGSFFLDPEDIRKLSIGAIWNFAKEQGSFKLVIEHGTPRACSKAKVHRARKGWNPNIIYSFNHSFFHSIIHSFIHSFFHSFIHSFIHSFFHSFIHSSIHPSIHSFFLSFIQSFIHLFFHSLIHSLFHSFIHSFIQDCTFLSTKFRVISSLVFGTNFRSTCILFPENIHVHSPFLQ
jgi:hypothetical protein